MAWKSLELPLSELTEMKKLILTAIVALTCVLAYANQPMVKFDHRYMNIHLNMKLSKLATLEKMLPADLRKEIRDDYYFQIKKGLSESDAVTIKEGKITMPEKNGEVFTAVCEFPKFVLTLSDTTWEDLDAIFNTYIAK